MIRVVGFHSLMRDENFFVLLSYAKKRPRYIYDGQQMGIWHGKTKKNFPLFI
jgi:hypothetical protein